MGGGLWLQRATQCVCWNPSSVRANRAADALEAAVVSGAYSGPMNAAQIVLGVALALIAPRLPMWKWQEGRPSRLSAWFDTIATRP